MNEKYELKQIPSCSSGFISRSESSRPIPVDTTNDINTSPRANQQPATCPLRFFHRRHRSPTCLLNFFPPLFSSLGFTLRACSLTSHLAMRHSAYMHACKNNPTSYLSAEPANCTLTTSCVFLQIEVGEGKCYVAERLEGGVGSASGRWARLKKPWRERAFAGA
jgi:hypothetical protein